MESPAEPGGTLLTLLSDAAWILSVLAACLALVVVGMGAFMAITGRFVAFTHPIARTGWRSPRRFGSIQVLGGVTILMLASGRVLSLHPVYRVIVAGLAFIPGLIVFTLVIKTLRATSVPKPEQHEAP